jgi:hypothetical protein
MMIPINSGAENRLTFQPTKPPSPESANKAAPGALRLGLDAVEFQGLSFTSEIDAPEVNEAEAKNLAYLLKLKLGTLSGGLTAEIGNNLRAASSLTESISERMKSLEIPLTSSDAQNALASAL